MNVETVNVEATTFKGRSGKSRQIALDHYLRHECIFCGLAVSDVLEVAHLDMDHTNDAIENLALMCPTCHRMHDLDLIPTDVVRPLRDQISNDGNSSSGEASRCSFCKRPLRKKFQLIQVADVAAQLCPCCEERHELGVLKSELILLMHRANKEPKWSKLMKDAGKKASIQRDIGILKTRYNQSKNPAVKANLKRKIQPLEKKKASLR
ncbi:MAG: HNH endonuclease [Terrimicrobiaceae bacterium]